MNGKTKSAAGFPDHRPRAFDFPWSLVGALVFFGFLWMCDFPKPMVDDLFYSGAGLNLATGGDLSNPLLARQHFPWHSFIIYPPVNSYVLAGWLKIFGISAATMTGFQILTYFITAAATIGFLRKENAPRWLEWLVPLGVAAALLPYGFRTEPLAIALTMAGFVLMEYSGGREAGLFLGVFLLSLGIATAPRTSFFGIALLMMASFQTWKVVKERGRTFRGGIFVMTAAILAAFLVFSAMLDFHVLEFWKAFRFHGKNFVEASKLTLLGWFFTRYLIFTQWPVVALLLLLLAMSFRAPWRPLKWVGFVTAGVLPVLAMVSGLGPGTVWFMVLAIVALAAIICQSSHGRFAKVAVPSCVIAVLLLANIRTFIHLAGIVSGEISSAPSPNRAEIMALQSTPEHPMLVDQYVARYVFDYRIPKQFIYWPFASAFPHELATETALQPDDIYLLGPQNVEKLDALNLTHSIPQPMWGIWKKRWSEYREPRRAFIIPVKSLTQVQSQPVASSKSNS